MSSNEIAKEVLRNAIMNAVTNITLEDARLVCEKALEDIKNFHPYRVYGSEIEMELSQRLKKAFDAYNEKEDWKDLDDAQRYRDLTS